MSQRRAGGDDARARRARRSAATSRWTDYAQWLDGLVLHGGADVSPRQLWRGAAAGPNGPATGSATNTRSTLVAAFERARQAGVRRLPRPAAAQRGATAARCTRTSQTQLPEALHASRRRGLRPATSTRRDRAGLAAGAAVPRRRQASRSTASITRRIKDLAPGFVVEARQPRRRRDRGDPPQRRGASRICRRAVASRVPPARSRTPSTTRALLDDFLPRAASVKTANRRLMSTARHPQPRQRRADRRTRPPTTPLPSPPRPTRRAPRSRPGRRGRWPSARPASRAFAPAWCATWSRWPRP